MRPCEVAELLRISAKTMANWRSSSKGPAWRKHGGRVVYRRDDVLRWSAKSAEPGQIEPRTVSIAIRPYPRDKSRSLVDISITHPGTNALIRRRLTAPVGMGPVAARAWGESQVQQIMREVFAEQAKNQPLEIQTNQPANETQIRHPEAPKQSKAPTMGMLWDQYDEEVLSRRDAKKPTAKSYRIIWIRLAKVIKKIPCDRWTKADTERLAKSLEGLCARYANQCITVVTNLFKLAIGKWIEVAPHIPRQKPPKRKPMVVANLEDTQTLLEAARRLEAEDGEAYPVMLMLGVEGGLRPGEVSGLRWADIDWRRNQLMIQNQRPLPAPEDEETLPKYDEVGRVALGPRLRIELERLRERTGTAGRYVLRSHLGEAFYTSLLTERIARIHREAKMPVKRAHHMRHISASIIDDHPDARVSDVQAHLRHKSEATTVLYLHAIRGSDKTVRVGAILEDLGRQAGIKPASEGTTKKVEKA